MAVNAAILTHIFSGILTVIWRQATGLRTGPSFELTAENITAIAGQSVALPCTVNQLGKFKVVWMDQNAFPLTYDDRRVIDDPRFSIVRPYLKDWNLVISEVRPKDTGTYKCTINTDPVTCKIVNLNVKISPRFVDQQSSQNIVVREGDTVIFVCNVTGKPEPEVTWQRRHVTDGKVSYAVERLVTLGAQLILPNVTRFCSEHYFVYECFANNAVPPAVSRQFRLTVHYGPELSVSSRSTGQRRAREVVLDCTVAAFPPAADIYWERPPHGRRINDSDRHAIQRFEGPGQNTVSLRVVIRDLTGADFGEYRCVARSYNGKRADVVTIFEPMESEQHHLATASKRESSLHLTSTRSAIAVPEVKREKSSQSSRRLPSPSESRGNIFNRNCRLITFIISLWLSAFLANCL